MHHDEILLFKLDISQEKRTICGCFYYHHVQCKCERLSFLNSYRKDLLPPNKLLQNKANVPRSKRKLDLKGLKIPVAMDAAYNSLH